MKLSTALLAGALVTVAVPAGAQSLGDLAKKEAERRKAAPPATKTYTNGDLKTPATPAPADADSKDASKPADTAKSAAKADKGDKADVEKVDSTKPAEPAKDENYWRGRVTATREDIRRNESFKEAPQSRINALSADFAARDDPYQRAKIADD